MYDQQDLLDMLAELAALHSAAATLAERAYTLVAASTQPHPKPSTPPDVSALGNGHLIVSAATCCVQWHGRRCILGPSLPFRMIHRLSRHPNRFFTYDLLMDEVWQGRCTDDAVRALVKRLRAALKDAGMAELASCIQARGRCVGLFLDGRMP